MKTLELSDDLMARLEVLALEAGEPVGTLVECLLRDCVQYLGFEGRLPALRMPPGTPPVKTEDVKRILEESNE